VDFDSQANLTSGLGADKGKPTVYQLISQTVTLEQVIQETSVRNLYVIPGQYRPIGSRRGVGGTGESGILFKKRPGTYTGKVRLYIDRLSPILRGFDPERSRRRRRGIDTPPVRILRPRGPCIAFTNRKKNPKNLNTALEIGGIFFTMYDQRTRLAQDVVRQVTGYFKDRVFKTIIPRNVRLSEAPSHGIPISQYDALCVGARSYQSLAQEVLQRDR